MQTQTESAVQSVVSSFVKQAIARENHELIDSAITLAVRPSLFRLFIGITTEKQVKTVYGTIQDAICLERGKPSNQTYCGGLKNRRAELLAIVQHKYATFEYVVACLGNGISYAEIERAMDGLETEVVGNAVDKVLEAMTLEDAEIPAVEVITDDWESMYDALVISSELEVAKLRTEHATMIAAVRESESLKDAKNAVA